MNKTLLSYIRKFNIEEDSVFKIEVSHNEGTNKFDAICYETGSKFHSFVESEAVILLKAQIIKDNSSFAIIEPFKGVEHMLSIYDCGKLVLKQKWVM